MEQDAVMEDGDLAEHCTRDNYSISRDGSKRETV